MIVRRKIPWVIGVIAVLVLLASVSSATSVKRKLRRKPTTRVPYQQPRIGSVIIKVIHKYSEDDLAHGVSANCTGDTCRNARDKSNFDNNKALSEEDNFFSNEESFRYIVYPKKYEHFVSRKNAGHASRYKRHVALPESRLSNASDLASIDPGDNASKASRNENKGKLKKVTQKTQKRIKIKYPSTSSSETSRTRRDLAGDYLSRRNVSDYYAQRKAVMERYYARQREINARYANQTSNISRRSDATTFRLGLNRNSTAGGDLTTFRQSAVKIDPIHSNKLGYNRIPIEFGNRGVAPGTDLDFKSDADLSQTRNSGNIERNALDDYVTPTPCTNVSLSGTFAPKTRHKHTQNCSHETERSDENTDTSIDRLPNNGSDYKRWGRCDGRVVYQHNLLLGLKGPSNLDALFEVIIQGPICITCVETMRYNETKAMVMLDSGGRGYDFVKLKLTGYENEGFSYIIKVWGIKKIDQNCNIG